MNNGSRRRGRRRYRIRYDRIIAVALVLIVLIFLMVSCAKGCSDDDKKPPTSQNSVVDELTSGQNPAATDANGQNITDPSGNTVTQPVNTGTAEFTTEPHEYADINKGDLVLVNSLYAYKFLEGDVTISTLYNTRNDYYGTSDNVLSLDSEVITQINALMAGYAAANSLTETDLRVIGGYRTLEAQNDKYMNGNSKFQGGYTDYHSARCFDVGIFPKTGSSGYYTPSAGGTYGWINDNAASYGFVVRFPEGKETVTGEDARAYTFRYVGVPHALFMKQNNLCLEEYTEQIKSYTNNNPLTVTNGTAVYQVYYVAANVNNVTNVPVPSNNLPYTVSGNNVDGFVVTVTISQ